MINSYRNAMREFIDRNVEQGNFSVLIVWDIQSDEAQDPTLLSQRIYGSRGFTDVILLASGANGIWEKLEEKRIAVPALAAVIQLRKQYLQG